MKSGSNYFWQNLERFSNKVALVDASTGKTTSYSELESAATDIANKIRLLNKGLIFLFTTNSCSCIVSYLSILKSGNAIFLLDEKLNEEIRKDLIIKYTPEYFVTSNETSPQNYNLDFSFDSVHFYKRAEFINDKIHRDLAVLLSTSGTTGSPKLVRLAYKNIQSNAESISEYLKIDYTEKPITTLPTNYSYGLSVINSHLLKGAAIVLTNDTALFRDFWKMFNEYQCTSFAGVPYTFFMLNRINFDKIDLPTLRLMTQAGGKLNEEMTRHFNKYALEKNIKFYIMYGQTEATARISYVPPEKLEEKIGSIGIPIPKGNLRIMNHGVEVSNPEEIGEIVYEGENVMLGYAENRKDLSKANELGGVLFTGDLGYMDKDGFYYVTGRLKRFIKIFGLRVNLDEVQKMVENHFGISVACTGKDDLLRVLVQPEDQIGVDNVKNEILKMYKLNFKTVVVNLIDKIPLTNSGKYDYAKINEMFN